MQSRKLLYFRRVDAVASRCYGQFAKTSEERSMHKRHTHDRRRRPRLADPLHRLTTRWRSGGVEQYPLANDETHRALKRMGSGFEITQHRIRLEVLPEAFRGFRIIQLTDIHHGVFLPGEMLRYVVETVNELEPDLVAVTGDFVTYSRAYIDPVSEILANVRAKHGVFAVLGNHDFAWAPTKSRNRSSAPASPSCATRTPGCAAAANHSTWRESMIGITAQICRAPFEAFPKNSSTILLSHNPGHHPSRRERKYRPGPLRPHSRRPGKYPIPGKYLGPLARTIALQSRLGAPGPHADLRQPRNRHHRATAAIPLPGGNSASRARIGCTPRRTPPSPGRLAPATFPDKAS